MEKTFFKQYPDVRLVLKVGDKLYLSEFQAEAEREAKLQGLTVEFIDNPKTTASNKTADTQDATK